MTDIRFPDYDASYPPSILNPPTDGWATSATAGTPGTWLPAGSSPQPSLAALQSSATVAVPATGWTLGQYVQTGTAGAPGEATWTGTGWVGGRAPALAFDPAEWTVDEVKDHIENFVGTDDELVEETQRVLDAERGNLARVTLLAWLDARPGVV